MTSWSISPLRAADADVLGPLHSRLWRETYGGLLPEQALAARDATERTEAWRRRGEHHELHGASAEGAVTLVAHDASGRPVGWVTVGACRDDDPPAPVELWSLYVAPEQQGSGVAQTLLAAHLPPGRAYLWVLRGNDRAIAFYRKAGFVADGVTTLDERLGGVELRMVRG